MSRATLPKNEDVWGTIQTKNFFKFIITYNVINDKYSLYRKVNSYYNKIGSSTDANALIKKISELEEELDGYVF